MFSLLTIGEIIDIMEQLRSEILTEHLSVFMKIASMLAAFLAGWTYIRVSHDYMEGQGVTFWMFLKPLVMVILVCNFNTFVLSPLHSVATMFAYDLTDQVSDSQDAIYRSIGEGLAGLKEDALENIRSEWNDFKERNELTDEEVSALMSEEEEQPWYAKALSWGRAFLAAMTGTYQSITNIHRGGFTVGLLGILQVLMYIIYYCQVLLCFIYLTVYGLLGPFALSFSILNSYSRSITDWFARYVQTLLWIPVGQVVFLIGSVVMENISLLTRSDVGSAGAFVNFNIGSYMGIIVTVTICFSILAVPKICSYIIESTGTAGAAQTVSGGAAKAAHVAARAAKL